MAELNTHTAFRGNIQFRAPEKLPHAIPAMAAGKKLTTTSELRAAGSHQGIEGRWARYWEPAITSVNAEQSHPSE